MANINAMLLKLKPGDLRSQKTPGPAKLSGFAAVSDKDYYRLRSAVKLLEAL
jgi:hypothetical protein